MKKSLMLGIILSVNIAHAQMRSTELCQGWQFLREDAQSENPTAGLIPEEADLVTKGTFPTGIAPQTVHCEPRTARYICLETLSSYLGPCASVAEFDLLDEQGKPLNRQNWKVVYADSEEAEAGDLAANAIDGNPQTKWHTQWVSASPGQPHTLVIDLHAPVRFAGFRYLPRQDGNASGMTKDWKFFARTEPFKLPAAKPEVPEIPRNANWETVSLPHTVKIDPPTTGGSYFRGGCWYQRVIEVDPAWAGRRVSLQFDGAMQKAFIFVNGVNIGTHLGGYLPFVVNLTPYLPGHDRVTVALYLDNNASPEFPPGSNRIDFTFQGGLYRPVHLIVTDPVHISNAMEANRVAGGGVFVRCESANDKQAVALAQTCVKNDSGKSGTASVEHILLAPDGREVARESVPSRTLDSGTDAEFVSRLIVTNPQLWTPDHPWLYTLISVVKKDGAVCDTVRTRCGLRWLEVTDAGLILNGKHLVLRGANRHMSFPWLGNAGSDNMQYRDIRLLKEAGFNYVRLCHYPQSEATMNACDELGMMAIVCTPGWQFFADNDSFKREAKQNIREMVRWHRNHPSAVLWEVSLNETYGHDSFYEECSNIAREEYPGTQILTSGDSYAAKNIAFYDVPYSDWPGFYGRPLHPGSRHKTALHREYGDYEFGGQVSSTRVPRGTSERQLLVQAWNFQWAHNMNLSWPWTLGDSIWAGIDCDSCYPNALWGPLDWYRLPKFSYYFFQSQRDPAVKRNDVDSGPMVHIAAYWSDRPAWGSKVVVYSNCDEVELFLNGKSIGRQKPDSGPDCAYGLYRAEADPMYWAKKKDTFEATKEGEAAAKLKPVKSDIGYTFDGGNCRHLNHPPFTFIPVPYAPGELKAVAYIGGKVAATNIVRTPGKPVALRLRAPTLGRPLRADGSDALFVYADVLDAAGAVATANGPVVTFHVDGPGHLVMPEQSNAEAGIAPMMVQAADKPGTITVTATAPGLETATLDIPTANPQILTYGNGRNE